MTVQVRVLPGHGFPDRFLRPRPLRGPREMTMVVGNCGFNLFHLSVESGGERQVSFQQSLRVGSFSGLGGRFGGVSRVRLW